MDSTYIEEQQIVARYVRGTLSPDEAAAFELHMLDHPEIADEVEYEKGLQHGLLAAKDTLFGEVTLPTRQGARFRLEPPYAAAATVLLAVSVAGMAYLFRSNVRLGSEVDALRGPSAVSSDVWLEPMRGTSSLIVEKRADEGLLLRVLVAGPGPYEVRIRAVDGRTEWTRPHVSPNADNALLITAGNLPFGSYELTATPESGARTTSTYAFNLVPPK